MKKLIYLIALLAATSTAEAQVIKEINPTKGENGFYICYTDEGAANFAKAEKYLKEHSDDMLNVDWDYLNKLGYDEMSGDYFDPIGEGCSWYCGDGGPIKITASSRLASQGANNYNEKNLHDYRTNTPWVEGVQGYGIGEWVEYTFKAKNPRITTINIVTGYNKSQSAWKNNSRVKKLKLYIKGKPVAILNLEDCRCVQSFVIDPVTDANKEWTMKFEIVDVYKGDKWDDTAISEIYFDGLDVHCFAAGTKVLLADRTSKNIEDIQEGDRVMSFNSLTNTQEPATVQETAAVTHCNLVTYTFDNGATITATDDHPLLTTHGWASMNPVKSANYKGFNGVAQIAVGDKFITESGVLTLQSTSVSHNPQKTYTIVRLSNGDGFYANGVAVGAEEVKEMEE
ncbi:MAG: hypothetical protein IIT83_07840 [Bacteroidales bacterium]|nr:hypothetical protein [Bacteroidales bacterium]